MIRKFTPGPWWASRSGEILRMPEQIKISNNISGSTVEEAKANARLIVEAPGMSYILEAALPYLKRCDTSESHIIAEIVEKVIKRIEG